jgi:LlaJI restriction endonuclease.
MFCALNKAKGMEINMKVYNAFLMPFDSLKSKYLDNTNMYKVGEAVSNWKDNTEEYQKIQGVLLDVKTLMSINVRQEIKEIEKLAKLVEN